MVCRFVTIVSSAKTAGSITMLFELWTQAGPRNHVSVGYWTTRGYANSRTGQLADAIGDFACLVFLFGGICETASCPVTYRLWVHIGDTWRIRFNRSRAVTMRPLCRLTLTACSSSCYRSRPRQQRWIVYRDVVPYRPVSGSNDGATTSEFLDAYSRYIAIAGHFTRCG